MIELVIKIPETEIPKQQDIIEIPLHFIDGKVCEAGGYEFDVLPKGHGDLKDMGNLQYVFDLTREDSIYSGKDIEWAIKSMETIIEADKAESEDKK